MPSALSKRYLQVYVYMYLQNIVWNIFLSGIHILSLLSDASVFWLSIEKDTFRLFLGIT